MSRPMPSCWGRFVVSGIAGIACTAGSSGSIVLVPLIDDQAPLSNVEPGITYSEIRAAFIDNQSRVLVYGGLEALDMPIGLGFWLVEPTGTSRVVTTIFGYSGLPGTPSPSANVVIFMRASGDMVVRNGDSVYVGEPRAFRLAFDDDYTLPGEHPDAWPYSFDRVFPTEDGRAVVFAEYAFSRSGLWLVNGSTVRRIISQTMHPPGMDSSFSFSTNPSFETLDVGPYGSVAFTGSVRDDQFRDASGLWTGVAGSLQLRLMARDRLDWPFDQVGFTSFSLVRLNDHGDLAFIAGQYGPGLTTSEEAVWLMSTGAPVRLLGRNDEPPGIPGTVIIDVMDHRLADNGRVAMTVRIAGDGVTAEKDTALLEGTPGALQLVLREGDPVSERPGVTYGILGAFVGNSTGQLLLEVDTIGPGDEDNLAVCLYRPASGGRELTVALREGEQIAMAPGDTRTISELDASPCCGGDEATGTTLNDHGEFSVAIGFTDGSSVAAMGWLAACQCEFDQAAGVTIADLLAFLDLWFSSDAAADLAAPGGVVDVQDLLLFLDCWFTASGGSCD